MKLIAARHCSAAAFEETDWPSICNLYDRLLEVAPSPVTEFNLIKLQVQRAEAVLLSFHLENRSHVVSTTVSAGQEGSTLRQLPSPPRAIRRQ